MSKGEFKTLLDLVEGHKKIVIPIIQRDYAQGRLTEKELREGFIDYLKANLENPSNQQIELDFIYGTLVNNSCYTILDGQQRLTTLFLLHWYLSKKEECFDKFKNSFSQGSEVCFMYETRASAEEFCKAIILKPFSLKDNLLQKKKLSDSILNMNWFMPLWKDDQTVKSMLIMLDTIHESFKESKGELYQKLVEKAVGFSFLNLEDFKLTDDLYIKMNATGLPLTSFENFKAHLEQFLKKESSPDRTFYLEELDSKKDGDKNATLQEYFSFRLDALWLDYFWKIKQEHQVDKFMMRFFHVVFTNYYYETDNDWSDFIRPQKETDYLSCKKYHMYKLLTSDNIKKITTFLDIVANPISPFADEKLKSILFKLCTSGAANYKERLLLYAYFMFIATHAAYSESNDIAFDKYKELTEWIRIIDNLTENTDYDGVLSYARDIKVIKNLLPHSLDILDYLSKNEISGFNGYQAKEERLKAQLLTSNSADKWYPLILKIEQHGYLKSQIFFLLELSEITSKLPVSEWDSKTHAENQESLQTNYQLFTEIFDEKGLRNNISEYCWERALLTKGDYLISGSFCVNSDRDCGWKRFFRERSGILKDLFLDILSKQGNISEKLNKIIQAAELSKIDSWRQQFIQLPKLFKIFGEKSNRYIRKDSDQGTCVLTQSRMSSYHIELYSYVFYLKHVNTLIFKNIAWSNYHWSTNSEEDDQPCAVLSFKDTEYNLYIYAYDYNQYAIWTGNEDNGIIDTSYIHILEAEGFKKHGDGNFSNLYKLENIKDENAVISIIKKIDEKL